MFFTEWCAGPKFSLRLNLLYFGPLPNSVSSSVTTYGKVRQCCDIVLSAFFFLLLLLFVLFHSTNVKTSNCKSSSIRQEKGTGLRSGDWS